MNPLKTPMKPMSNAQTFRIADALRCSWNGLPSGPNLASPREQLAGPAATRPGGIIWQDAVMKSRNRVSFGYWDGKKMWGMASARSRPGHKSWEIDRLYLYGSWPSLDYQDYGSFNERWDMGWYEDFSAEDAELELLEQVTTAICERGAQRIFIRLPANAPALAIAKRFGFTEAVSETLLEGYGGNTGGVLPPKEGPSGMRLASDQDEYGLFQLYCATVPAKAREALGLTFDQWQERRDKNVSLFKPAGHREWVADGPDRLAGWLRISRRWIMADVQLMNHPDHPGVLYPALDYALAQPGILRWLIPDYLEPVAERLGNRGFRRLADYTMLVKMVAVPARDYGMAPVEA